MKLNTFLTTLSMLLLGGCSGPTYNVTVDSICSSFAAEKNKFVLIPANKDCEESNLQYMEFAAYTENTLTDIGFEKASSIDKANIAILLSYGISDPKFYEYTYSTPVWGQTGVSSSNTYGSINTYGNCATYSQNTSYTPQYGIIGSTTHTGIGVSYVRHFILNGIDLEKYREEGKVHDLRRTTAISSGPSGDLRRVFPVLLGASKKYIASNTGQELNISLKETDQEVLGVKGVKTKVHGFATNVYSY